MTTTMSFSEAVKNCFSKAVTFTGRSRRSEFWYWQLFNIIASLAIAITSSITANLPVVPTVIGFSLFAWNIFSWLVSFSVSVRRLHDTGHSGWWYGGYLLTGFVFFIWIIVDIVLVAVDIPDIDALEATDIIRMVIGILGRLIIPYIIYFAYGILLLVWMCTDSHAGANKYGENPKEYTPETIPSAAAAPVENNPTYATTAEFTPIKEDKSEDNKSEDNYNKEI
jgi:uncharacterized membrane protein YhaH (DUF805 family)